MYVFAFMSICTYKTLHMLCQLIFNQLLKGGGSQFNCFFLQIGIMEDLEDMRMEAMEKKKAKKKGGRRISDD